MKLFRKSVGCHGYTICKMQILYKYENRGRIGRVYANNVINLSEYIVGKITNVIRDR